MDNVWFGFRPRTVACLCLVCLYSLLFGSRT